MRNFIEDICYQPPSQEGREAALAFAGYGDAIAIARAAGDIVIEGPCFWSQPSGPISAQLYAVLSGAILDRLRDSSSVDAVILNLHGAMVVEGLDDPEGDLLRRVREAVGWKVPIGALLDLHGNVTVGMVETGALLIGVKEYPHTDYRDRAAELHALLSEVVRNEAQLATTLRTIPLLSLQGTTEEPMHGLVRELFAAEKESGIRSVTLMHGFPWSDTAETGAAVVIISDHPVREHAKLLAEKLADRFWKVATGAPVARLGVAAAVTEATKLATKAGPVVIADSSDNPGGGAACDSTFLLRELILQKCENAALGMIWDPQVTQIAADAGVGAHLSLRIGGKVGPLSGDPLDVFAEVTAVRHDARQRFFNETPNAPLGLAVALRIAGIDVVVNSIRQQVFSPECFEALGIDLSIKSIVVVKSSQHFRAYFDRISKATLYCDAPGSLNVNLAELPYRNLRVDQFAGAFATNAVSTTARWPISAQSAGRSEDGALSR
jgi:microcystin degradation protein MlrC